MSVMNTDNINKVYAELLNSVECGVFVYTVPQYEIFNINKEARNIVEIDESEDTKEAFERFQNEMIHPEDRTRVLKDNANIIDNGGEVSSEYRIIGKNGIKYIRSVTKMLVSENEQKYILVSLTDISNLVRLMKLLERERKSCREALIKNCEFGFFFDLTEGLVYEEFVTSHELGIARKLGLEVPVNFDDLTREYVKAVNPLFSEKGMEIYLTQKGLIAAYEKGNTCVITEFYVPAEDKYIRTNAIISKDDETEHLQAFIVAYDITEIRKKHEEQRRTLINRNMQLLSLNDEITDQLGSGILAYTLPERHILVFNQEARRMFDVPELNPEILNYDVTYRIIQEDKSVVRKAVKKLVKPGDSVEYTIHNLKKDGTIAALKCRTKLLAFADGEKYILSSIIDITEQENFEKRLEEERQRYETALTIGSFAFFSVDLTEGKIKEHIKTKKGDNLTEELGLTVPVYYDDFARVMFDEKRIIADGFKAETLRSRKRLISAYKEGMNVIYLDYEVPEKGMDIHLILMLHKKDKNVNATFIFYDNNK